MNPQYLTIALMIQYVLVAIAYAIKGDVGRAWYFLAAFQINCAAVYFIK